MGAASHPSYFGVALDSIRAPHMKREVSFRILSLYRYRLFKISVNFLLDVSKNRRENIKYILVLSTYESY